jgi:serine/threonine protein kinase
LPDQISWPFNTITAYQIPEKKTLLLDKYKTIKTLKEDAKGNVTKALWLKKWYSIKPCIIREGRLGMLADAQGRDMSDRLVWQYEINQDLRATGIVPEVYDLFEENGNMYMTMSYIKGISLDQSIRDIYQSRIWEDLSKRQQLLLLDCAEKLVESIIGLHKHGYIHRDISHRNFLVRKDGSLVMIDLELAFSEKF